MARCSFVKPDGIPCERIVKASQTLCYSHHPARAGERQRNASRATRSKPNQELKDIKAQLSDLANGVQEGSVDRGSGAVIAQILNVYLRAITTEMKFKEITELEERVAALERTQEREKGQRKWRGA